MCPRRRAWPEALVDECLRALGVEVEQHEGARLEGHGSFPSEPTLKVCLVHFNVTDAVLAPAEALVSVRTAPGRARVARGDGEKGQLALHRHQPRAPLRALALEHGYCALEITPEARVIRRIELQHLPSLAYVVLVANLRVQCRV